jgi:hypothetical protein
MEYKPVVSSQIAEVGHDADTSTLGIRFHPTKKQKEAGQPGAKYHYANVPAKLAEELSWALSVGKFFAEHIKAHPDLYPFTKIEPNPAAEA